MKQKITNRIYIFLLFIIFIPTSSYSQNTIIKGQVTNNNGAPLPFVSVALLNVQDSSLIQGTISNTDGTFALISKYNEGIVRFSNNISI